MTTLRRPAVRGSARRGATSVEFAIVASTVLLLLIGLIVGALGVFRYQEIARLAREGARYAAVRGEAYARTTGRVKPDLLEPAIRSNDGAAAPAKQEAPRQR